MHEFDRFVARLAAVESTVRDLGGTPQLHASSIVDGALEQVVMVDTGQVDENGQPIFREEVVARFGAQSDGTYGAVALTGPTPPTPTEPHVTAGPGFIAVEWDGLFEDGEEAPLDFLHVAVHCAPVDVVDDGTVVMPSPDTLRNVISTEHGASVVIGDLDAGSYYVSLVTVTKAGVWSEPALYSSGAPGSGASAIDVIARETAAAAAADAAAAKAASDAAWAEAQTARANAQAGIEEASKAQQLATTALSSADGKSTSWWSPNAPTAEQGADGDTWWQRDPATGLVTHVYERASGAWTERKMTSSTIDSLNVGQLDAGVLRAGVSIVTGDPAGTHTELGNAALISWRLTDPEAGPTPSFILGGKGDVETPDAVQLINPATGIASGFDSTGAATFSSTMTDELFVNGSRLGGESLDDLLFQFPRGVQGIFKAKEDSPHAGTAEVGICEVAATCVPYRRYRAIWTGNVAATAGSTTYRLFLRITNDGSAPSTGSSQLTMSRFVSPPTAGDFSHTHLEGDFFVPGSLGQESTVRVGVSLHRTAGTGDVWHYSDGGRTPGTLTIVDLGPQSGVTAELYDDGQMTAMGGTPVDGAGAMATVVKKSYTRTYTASWSRSWRAGAVLSGTQVRSGFSSGQLVGAIGAPAQMYADISGASVAKLEVWLYARRWYRSDGGIARIGAHAETAAPTALPTSSGTLDVRWTSRSGGRWFTIPASWYPYFLSGRNRGITVGYGAGTTTNFYGRFDGYGETYPPKFRVTYRK